MHRTPENCCFRANVQPGDRGEIAECQLVHAILGQGTQALSQVPRPACEACVRSSPPTFQLPNPVIASLLYNAAEKVLLGANGAAPDRGRAAGIQRWVEPYLAESPVEPEQSRLPWEDRTCVHLGERIGSRWRSSPSGLTPVPVHACLHPHYLETTAEECRHCRDWSLEPNRSPAALTTLFPNGEPGKGPQVRDWAVGVTTAPRLRPTLEATLQSLVRAGWDQARIFVDGQATVPLAFAHFPIVHRQPVLGAWPNYYLGLVELLLREPDADAYLMLQDDVLLHGSSDLRRYLEHYLWPDENPGIVSLYCAQMMAREPVGWHRHGEPWLLGAMALIFSPEAARRFVSDRAVVEHRRKADGKGLTGIDTVVGEWAHRNSIPLHHPTPSLCQHIGTTSALWIGRAESAGRRPGPFSEDVVAQVQAGWDHFPEYYFPCTPCIEDEYRRLTTQGRDRMRSSSLVICALARDVEQMIPAQIERIEKLGQMFQRYQVVLYENDSKDDTRELLERWSRSNPRVHLLHENLGAVRYPQIRSLERAERMAYYRNRCREYAVSHFLDHSHLMVLDTDLEGGWSFDGIANTFGHADWDFVGSNGLLHMPGTRRDPVHFDAWAYRRVGHEEPHPNDEINGLRYLRGEPLQPVWSCFGGMGIYRMECHRAAQYTGEDCEHVCLHRALRRAGYTRLYLNPSQITMYNRV